MHGTTNLIYISISFHGNKSFHKACFFEKDSYETRKANVILKRKLVDPGATPSITGCVNKIKVRVEVSSPLVWEINAFVVCHIYPSSS